MTTAHADSRKARRARVSYAIRASRTARTEAPAAWTVVRQRGLTGDRHGAADRSGLGESHDDDATLEDDRA